MLCLGHAPCIVGDFYPSVDVTELEVLVIHHEVVDQMSDLAQETEER
jgi:hypothetical protein